MSEKDLPARQDASAVPMVPDTSRALGRAAADRVLRRAIELQASGGVESDALDAQQLERLAQELGIEPAYVRRALAEERAGLTAQSAPGGVGERLLGPRRLVTGRPVHGTPGPVLEAATEWLQRQEGLRIRRRLASGLSWERDAGALARLRAGLGLSRGTGHLRQADQVVLRVEPLDDDESLVTVEADVDSERSKTVAALAGTALAATAAGWIGADLMGPEGWAIALPSLLVPGAALLSRLRRRLERIRAGMERALDAVSHAEQAPPGIEERVTGALENARRLGTRLKLLSDAFRDGMKPDR
jgi:hypothetical protein